VSVEDTLVTMLTVLSVGVDAVDCGKEHPHQSCTTMPLCKNVLQVNRRTVCDELPTIKVIIIRNFQTANRVLYCSLNVVGVLVVSAKDREAHTIFTFTTVSQTTASTPTESTVTTVTSVSSTDTIGISIMISMQYKTVCAYLSLTETTSTPTTFTTASQPTASGPTKSTVRTVTSVSSTDTTGNNIMISMQFENF